MEPFSSAQLLEVWERGRGASLVSRAVDVLRAACPELDPHAIARLTIGARDELLLEVRCSNFGTKLLALAVCPACLEQVESTLDLFELKALRAQLPEIFEVCCGALRIEFRLPSSVDLLAALELTAPERARAALLERCIIACRVEGDAAELSASVLDTVAAEMERVDPLGDIQLAMTCECGHGFSVCFDVVSYLWREIEVAARRLLGEVHTLASAYGWPERDILALTTTRRRAYLERVSR